MAGNRTINCLCTKQRVRNTKMQPPRYWLKLQDCVNISLNLTSRLANGAAPKSDLK